MLLQVPELGDSVRSDCEDTPAMKARHVKIGKLDKKEESAKYPVRG